MPQTFISDKSFCIQPSVIYHTERAERVLLVAGEAHYRTQEIKHKHLIEAMTMVRAVQWILVMSAAYVASGAEVQTFQMPIERGNFTTHELCSTECKSEWCYVPPGLRYGKYCGIGYSGCDGQAPCDGLDSCCKTHDECIGDNLCNYLDVDCNQALIDCLNAFESSGKGQFPGATCSTAELVPVINAVIEIGVRAGKALNISGRC